MPGLNRAPMRDARIPCGAYWSTPFVRWQGGLSHLHPLEFAAHLARAELARREVGICAGFELQKMNNNGCSLVSGHPQGPTGLKDSVLTSFQAAFFDVHNAMSSAHGPQDLNFKTPPVVEVACGIRFAPLARLKMPHTGSFWSRIRDEYPNVEHAIPIADPTEFPLSDSVTGLPLPRVWFINAAESRLIQFQADRFYFNWRKRDNDSEYPRYPEMIGGFSKHFRSLESWLADEGIGTIEPISCELTYTNHLDNVNDWQDISALGSIFRDFSWESDKSRLLAMPKNMAWQATFAMPDSDGSLQAKLSPAKKATTGQPIYVFELSCRGVAAEKTLQGLLEWFDAAHRTILDAFADLTTKEAQNETWGAYASG